MKPPKTLRGQLHEHHEVSGAQCSLSHRNEATCPGADIKRSCLGPPRARGRPAWSERMREGCFELVPYSCWLGSHRETSERTNSMHGLIPFRNIFAHLFCAVSAAHSSMETALLAVQSLDRRPGSEMSDVGVSHFPFHYSLK